MHTLPSISRTRPASPSSVEPLEARIAPAFAAVFELSGLTGANGFKISGVAAGDVSGGSVSNAGDINGDGFDDLIIGAYRADANGFDSGASYVVFGSGTPFAANLNLSGLTGANGFRVSGEAGGDSFGYSVSTAGDINGDGLDDLIIGSYRAAPNGTDSGASYLVFGSLTPFAANLNLSGLTGANGFKISGAAAADRSGYSVSTAGDINGDGFDDLLIGAPDADPNGDRSGANYVIFGSNTPFAANLELSALTGANGFKISGDATDDRSGRSVSNAGDINGDGFDDLIIAAPSADPSGLASGASYVVFGNNTPFAANLNFSGLTGANGFKISGIATGDFSGWSVSAAGDINGDGFDDLLIGAPEADPNGNESGASYVVFGSNTPFAANLTLSGLTGTNGFKISGVAANDRTGESVSAAGDINGDGIDDLIIGARYADPNGTGSGASYVIFGSLTPFTANLKLSGLTGANGFKITGVAAGDDSGKSVSAAGDINGDGFDDLIIGAPRADPNGERSGASYVVFGTPFLVEAGYPLTFKDADGDLVRVTLNGSGFAKPQFPGAGAGLSDLTALELFDTDLKTSLSVALVSKTGTGTGIGQILTQAPLQHLGSLTLGSNVTLGDGITDSLVDLRVSGALKALTLDDIAANTSIRLGEDLPYDEADKATPDTKNHFPTVEIGDVLGAGVELVVLGKDAPLTGLNAGQGTVQGIGGGGLGNVTIRSWAFPGFIRTTQSIGDLLVTDGDFYASLEVDRFSVGVTTVANVGKMTVLNGVWGGSSTEIEGAVTAFNAEAFLAAASITAGSVAKVKIGTGTGSAAVNDTFDGILILTEDTVKKVAIVTVNGAFTGSIVAASSLKSLKIKGDFTGSLSAPSIGAITAYSFLGTPGVTSITATKGVLGQITSTAGIVKDYTFVTDLTFTGLSVRLGKLATSTTGIENVHITAASIGKISVSLAAAKNAPAGVELIGIDQSSFTTKGNNQLLSDGTTKTIGKIGNVSVTIAGAANGGHAIGMRETTFDARVLAGEFTNDAAHPAADQASENNSLGKITVKLSGAGGNSLGLDRVAFEADTIGASSISVSRGKLPLTGPTARALETVRFTADTAVGAIKIGGDATAAQATALSVWSGGTVGAVAVKATKAEFGSLVDSHLLAGQSLDMSGPSDSATLKGAALGAVAVSGSILNTDFVAGGSIGAVSAGQDLADSLVLAGAKFGGDFALDGDETYQRTAAIAAITVKGAFARTSIVAGIDPVNGIFGDGDDALAAAILQVDKSSSIGLVSIGAGGSTAPGTPPHPYAIQAAALTGLKLGAAPTLAIPSPLVLDSEVLVRVLV